VKVNNNQAYSAIAGPKELRPSCLSKKGRSTIHSTLFAAMTTEPSMNPVRTLLKDRAMNGYLEQASQAIEKALSGYLPSVSKNADTRCPARLAAAMRYSALGGGKRIRPILCLMAAEACGGDCELALPAACALEMIHTYSLIHDDLPAMDNDDLRRGRSTCHRAFDEATAILAGDALLTLAFELVAREIKPDAVASRCVLILAEASGYSGMIGGQMADLQAERCTSNQNHASEALFGARSETAEQLCALEAIHRRKTGELLKAPLLMGALIAGASETCASALDRYGRAIGLAFQIVDDLLDVQGDESKLGKRVGKDSDLGKWTYPRFLGLDGSRRRARELVEEATAAIEPFGPLGNRLRDLALALLERDR
jgi:geranylgeranyl diphosphate synthase type II